jgi:hypothetical protein
LCDVELAASIAAAFAAAFLGAHFGYWLSERAAARARASEAHRRAGIAAIAVAVHFDQMHSSATNLPKTPTAVVDPEADLRLYVPDLWGMEGLMRAMVDLPDPAGKLTSNVFDAYSRLIASARMVQTVASTLRRPVNPPSPTSSGGLAWIGWEPWNSGDAMDPRFLAAWKELDRSRGSLLAALEAMSAELARMQAASGRGGKSK